MTNFARISSLRAATFNADIASFYTKWLRELNDGAWDYGAYPSYAPRPLARPNEHHAADWMETRPRKLACSWKIENGKLLAEVTVPPNTTADLTLPVKGEISEGGSPAAGRSGISAPRKNQLTLGSGIYQFTGAL